MQRMTLTLIVLWLPIFLLLGLNDTHSLRFYLFVLFSCNYVKSLITRVLLDCLGAYYSLLLRETVVVAVRKWVLKVDQACQRFVRFE
jgi:hypothetical protein